MKSSIRILIVEDEALTAKMIEIQLKKMGYTLIDIAITYNQAMSNIQNETPDLILLDVNLKGRYTGIDIANKKEVLNQIPVIYITVHEDSQTKHDMFLSNPINYLPKPLQYEDLKDAIVLALKLKKGVIDIGYDFTYNLEQKNLFKKKEFIKLSPKEKLLLEQLIQANGKAVPAQILDSIIWEQGKWSPSSLRNLVLNLRKKLNPKMIETVKTLGYKLILPKNET